MKNHYVYFHRKLDDGSVFYVGKGSGGRWKASAPRSYLWRNTVKKHGFLPEIVMECQSEEEALLWESAIISVIGMDNLVNMTTGGDGKSGCYYRPVYCSNGMFFEGITLAAKWLRENGYPKATDTGINKCARGERDSAYGFNWSFSGTPSSYFKTREQKTSERSRKRVFCSNGMIFESASLAAEWLKSVGNKKANFSCVCHAARNPGSQSYGHNWSYVGFPEKTLTKGEKNAIKFGTPVFCSNGMSFASPERAAVWLRDKRGDRSSSWGIRNAARTQGKKFKDLYWSFKEMQT